ncbi:ABC transporter [Methanocella sp. CWC-04]|uniref:Cobalamin import ATP-binding protein BtuD n=1 Tax=Methanooceanicella nereidis TaxID=2052831 RepID=A0AAP2RD70_9EURY|nr:ABC transporter ATP-binding protein [Methanocella sp. CWC-04]MCD1295411.1 ABC transporter [Methanocella sp. CWC-04]
MCADVVELKDVWVYYDDIPVLENVNLAVHEHDFLGIIGPNGGGKTTLLKVILGLIKPSKGTVSIMGNSPDHSRKYIGYVPQHKQFDRDFPIKVWDVVMMGRLSHTGLFKNYSEEDKKATKEALERVEMLEFKDRQIGKLSGGQRQRVYIARALAGNPKLFLLDEPMTGVDSAVQEELYELLTELNKKAAIIMVSHDISAVSVHVNKLACLNHKLYYHDTKELIREELEEAYHCPVEFIAHGVPHRVLREHKDDRK